MAEPIDNLLREATLARREHRLDDAKRDLQKAVELCREAGGQQDLAVALTGLGQIERDMNHLDAARQLYEEAAAIYRTEGNPLKLAHTVRHVGDILRHEGKPKLAEPCYDEALGIYRKNRGTAQLDLANAIRGLAIVKAETGQRERAKALWEEARDLYAAVNVDAGVQESARRIEELASRNS